MDDLLGEDWQSAAKATAPKPTTSTTRPSTFTPQYSAASGTASPSNISRPSSTVNGTAAPNGKPGKDVFGNLTTLKSQKAGSNLSILEKQRRLDEEKRRQQDQQASLWDSLGSGRGTPEIRGPSPAPVLQQANDEDDILAAFNKNAPVDRASHYPRPSSVVSGVSTPVDLVVRPAAPSVSNGAFDDDDDPFGLAEVAKPSNGHAKSPRRIFGGDDDDVLGDLAKPVSQVAPVVQSTSRTEPRGQLAAINRDDEDVDHSLAELIEMGFAPESARLALSESNGDVQAAVGWLLRQAHEDSKRTAKDEAQRRRRSPSTNSRSPPRRRRQDDQSSSRQREDRSPANGADKDPAQVAAELGNKLFKSANSIWKASQKQMAKTMADFQQERDSSQPRWMQEATSGESSRASSQPRQAPRSAPRASQKSPLDITNEAAMLDAPREPRPSRSVTPASGDEIVRGRGDAESRTDVAAVKPRSMHQEHHVVPKPITKLSRQAVEEQTAEAYVSPARRKRPVPKPEPKPEPEVDLFSPAPIAIANPTATVPTSTPRPSTASKPINVAHTVVASRTVPAVSPAALSSSAAHRKKGGDAFKRGDYAAAHDSYTAALSSLPPMHPIAIIVLSNRSLTALKTGDAKMAVSDAEQAIAIIGESHGVGETIDLGQEDGMKDMREFYGKALMRKAEALEHMEKWTDAATTWRAAIAAGVGGAVSLQGRDRCERAAAPKAKPASKPKPPPVKRSAPPAKSLGDSMHRPALSSAVSQPAVNKLRAANAAADKADDEKFALTDQVDARLQAWKGGKADNLRALLQSLDAVLWPEADWKKVGMGDLVMPNKVKINYMKAIGKVHPDKISQTATTEQRMISAAVFSTLNEAWDKFKRDNGL
ncbi:auxilin-like clathrin-binding protein required for normal clathrin function [Oleoguttula sp. CCFEE 5521]